MSPTAIFLRRPMSFLERNIVITPLELERAANRQPGGSTPVVGASDDVHCLGLERLDQSGRGGVIVRGIRNGAPCSVYALVRTNPGDADAFKAYLYPRHNGGAGGMVINTKAELLFATTFDGDTLAVGPRSGSGDRLISSSSGGSAAPPQRRLQTATVFGRISQVSKDWVFCSARYECIASPGSRCYYHRGLVSLLDAVA
ncbi:hypothetical protein F6455_07270 [Proteobacteria bacterium 005FR1]|nr:hypothetical protein [Proteobacteria bacterium 005FR1]